MIVLIDNYDSFTYNIAQALGQLEQEVRVVRNDVITPGDIDLLNPKAIVISPGPGRPETAGISCDVIKNFAGRVPILGICLGHQCIAHVYDAQVVRADKPIHGKTWEIFHDGFGVYEDLRNPFVATRYHSLIVQEESLKSPLAVSAYTSEGEVMGVRSEELALEGVQFHPESIGTHQGMMIFRKFLEMEVK